MAQDCSVGNTVTEGSVYFVLNGLVDGEEGECTHLSDGWYFIFDGEDHGDGPFIHRNDAIAAQRSLRENLVKTEAV